MGYDFAEGIERDFHMASQESSNDSLPSFEGNHRELSTGHRLHHLQVEMIDRSHSNGTDAEFSGILPGIVDQFIKGFPRRTRFDRSGQRDEKMQPQWLQVLVRVV